MYRCETGPGNAAKMRKGPAMPNAGIFYRRYFWLCFSDPVFDFAIPYPFARKMKRGAIIHVGRPSLQLEPACG